MPAAMSRPTVLALAVAGCVLLPTPARAAAPDIVERHMERSGVFVSCPTFDVTLTSSIDARYIVSLDDEGQPVREIRHVSFTGTLTGPAGALPYYGHFTRTADLVAQTARFTGLHLKVVLPGEAPLLAAGTDAFSLDPDVLDGRATGRLPDVFYADVCAAMTA